MRKNKDDLFFESTLETLIKDLKSQDRSRGLYAIEVISAHAALASSTVPALNALVTGTDAHLARAARNALKKIEIVATA